MRLIKRNSAGELSLTKDFVGRDIPVDYAILSHTWGADSEEVLFKDMMDGSGKEKGGYRKIQFCADQAARDGLQYCWVDTCCIDKSNNTELTEAINSMFRWYENSKRCYVYLSDVSTMENDQVGPFLPSWLAAFQKSRWFRRGWTLQELIAPKSVEFFCSNCKRLGDKGSLQQQLHEITGIAISALQGSALSAFGVDERMSWAKKRETKREEDKAYSLLGLFDVHMTLIYGEGTENAFQRLWEKVHKCPVKYWLEERSIVSHLPSNSHKRLKTQHIPSPPLTYDRNSNSVDSEPVLGTECSVQGIDAATKQALVNQLYFTEIDERLTSLAAAQGNTCRWFFNKPEYISWHDAAQQPDHGGFLWIKGNPGTGKSTLMKLLFEHKKLKDKGDSLQITLSFFFLARGTDEEKSTAGLYRALLHQLFESVQDLTDSLEWMTADGAKVIQRNGWHEEALKQTLTQAIQKLRNRSLTIFVDALDECEKNQAAGMVCFFEELCVSATEAKVRLQICFSSRHYPTVVIEKGIEVVLEDEIGHEEDIEQYIKSKLRLRKSPQADFFRTEILKKSSSIFLWVVLVVDILNSELPDSSISAKRERLKQLPPKLNELFEMILTRDGENLERLQVCLQWILLATRPLLPQELYFAIQFSLDKNCSGIWDQEDIGLDEIKAFVRSSSKGLAEVTRRKASVVQFIHESVRDFLLGKYEVQWFGVSGNFVGNGHEVLKNCCLAQLKIPQSQNINAGQYPQGDSGGKTQSRDRIRLKFPFLEYSVVSVLCHANDAQQHSIDQRDFLTEFDLQRWIIINNVLEKFKNRQCTKSASMLYILAANNLADLIRIHPDSQSCFDVEHENDELFGPPIFAALASGSRQAVQAFLEIQAERQPEYPLLLDLCKEYSEHGAMRTTFSRGFTFSLRTGVFRYLINQGENIIICFLCASHDFDVDSKDHHDCAPLSFVSQRGIEPAVKILLERGAEIDIKNANGETPLFLAAAGGHAAVVKLLLECGAEIDSKDNGGVTPLQRAAGNGSDAVVKLLVDHGADLENKDCFGLGQTALAEAVQRGQKAVAELLLACGADVDTQAYTGQTLLEYVVRYGSESIHTLFQERSLLPT